MLKIKVHERKMTESFNPKTVTIDGKVWMTDNLDIDDGGEGIGHSEGDVYYDFDAAKRVVASLDGWHIPTMDEWERLLRGTTYTEKGHYSVYSPSSVLTDRLSFTGLHHPLWVNDGSIIWVKGQDVYHFYDFEYGCPLRLVKD